MKCQDHGQDHHNTGKCTLLSHSFMLTYENPHSVIIPCDHVKIFGVFFGNNLKSNNSFIDSCITHTNMPCCNISSSRMSPRRHEAIGGHSRRFPWDDPDFDPHKVLAELDRMPKDRNRHPREDLDEWAYLNEDIHSEDQRRSPSFPDDHQSGHQHHPDLEELYRRTPPSHPHELGYAERRRLSPKQAHQRRDGGGDRGRGAFREHFKNFENRARPPHSPQRLTMERLPPTPQSHSNHQQRVPATGWRREEQDRSQGRSRDFSPRARADEQGRGRGRRHAQGPNRERQSEEAEQERGLLLKRPRREVDNAVRLG